MTTHMTAGMVAGLALALPLTAALTGIVRWYAVRRGVMDIPNHRTSHDRPTPRGGGLAIVVVVLSWVGAGTVAGWLPLRLGAAVIGGGGLLAATNFVDDHGHVPAAVRAAVQLGAAAWAVYWLGSIKSLETGVGTVQLGYLDLPLTLLGIVALANIYNFMDGIDGLAGGEAVMVGGFGGGLFLAGGDAAGGWLASLLAVSAAGFLVWNWPPARIFMGDVGSGALGYWFATLILYAANEGGPSPLIWMLLLGVFLFDGGVTLVRRMLKGYAWYRPHRSHAYQRAVQAGADHRQVTGTIVLVNGVLAAMAGLASAYPAATLPVLVLALLSLTWFYLRIERARRLDESPESE